MIAELAEQREGVDAAIVEAVRSARAVRPSWSEIGAMLGMSKQAAHRKFAKVVSASPLPRARTMPDVSPSQTARNGT